MKSRTGRTWAFIVVLLVACAAARAQTTKGGRPSGVVADDEKKVPGGASLLGWRADTAGLSAGIGFSSNERPGPFRDAQPFCDSFQVFPKGGRWGMLLALVGESAAAGTEDDSKSAPAPDTTAPEQEKKTAASLEGVVTGTVGDAVSQAVVTIKDSGGKSRTAVTGADGRFLMRRVEAETPPNVNETLEGIVTDATGTPVAGAAVTVRDSEGRTITLVTNSEGKFRTRGVEQAYKPNAVGRGYKPNAFVGVTKPSAPIVNSSRVGFWAIQGLMLGSIIASVETTHNCLQAGSCTAIPSAFQSRTAMYNIELPVAAGVSFLSYVMKNRGSHWWYLPPAIVIGADTLLTVHSARASR